MAKNFAVYKGLQKPLIFRGFRGKFIYWGLGSLLAGLVLGALTMSLVNMWLGAIVLVGSIVGGLLYIAGKQKKRAALQNAFERDLHHSSHRSLWAKKIHLKCLMPALIKTRLITFWWERAANTRSSSK
jgi:hypothetical protein